MKNLRDFPDAQLRIFERPDPPPAGLANDVYLIGICGTGMGSLAGLFRDAGYEVRGSDSAAYPPMSTRLAEMGVTVIDGYRAENLAPAPDVVIVGNACVPTHPEATLARDRGLCQMSFPEALSHFFIRDRRSLVIAGTHGKTTTTGMLVHLLRHAGEDPGFLVGGVLSSDNTSYGVGSGRHFVVEGDEYDSAYFDKRPKFLHYRPSSAAVTSMEFDHADIYDDWSDYREAFDEFVRTVDSAGLLVLNGDDDQVTALANHASSRVTLFGIRNRNSQVQAVNLGGSPTGSRFRLVYHEQDLGEVMLPVSGRHNVMNALAAAAIALDEGVHSESVIDAFKSFGGIKRRQEIRAEVGGVTVVDDFAHHPTAVRETIASVRERWTSRRLVAVFEPRSNSSRRKVFESAYLDAFRQADLTVISEPPFRHNDVREDFMDVQRIVDDLQQSGRLAEAPDSVDAVYQYLTGVVEPGDVVLIMSNGGFGGLHDRLIRWLEASAETNKVASA